RPLPFELAAVEVHGQTAVALLLDELVRPGVPDLDRARPVLAGRDRPFERRVVERMVLDVHGEVPLATVERHALGNGPAGEDAVPLEPEVVVQPARIVALHHEQRLSPAFPAREGLRCPPLVTASLVLLERHRPMISGGCPPDARPSFTHASRSR